ncbi:NADH dehydrogenase 1 alpha subcomplex assembly factor 3 [Scleroderma yunnanense]
MTIVKTAFRPRFLNILGQPRACQSSLSIRRVHASPIRSTNHRPTSLTNILASEVPPPVQVASVSTAGIKLTDGLVFCGPVVFLEGKVFMWDVPDGGFITGSSPGMGTDAKKWDAWTKEHWWIFEVVVPKPEILVFGTGARMEFIPPRIRSYTRELGIQLEVMDTKNASSTYNLLAEEGRRVAAALLPLLPKVWEKKQGY